MQPGVVLVHGLGGTDATMDTLRLALNARGIDTIAVLLSGHGTTPGDLGRVTWEQWLDDVTVAAESAATGEGVVIVGQSLGGALALAVAAHRRIGAPLRALVAINTPVPDPDVVDGLEWRLSRGHTSMPSVLADGEVGYDSVPITALLTMATGLLTISLNDVVVPVTVINSADDEVLDPASGELLLSLLGSVRTRRVMLGNGGHAATLGPEVDVLADEVARLVVGSPT